MEKRDVKDATSLQSASSFENSKLAQPAISRSFFILHRFGHLKMYFTQFCCAKLLRTANRLYCLYPIYPSAALWNPNSFIHFNFLGTHTRYL